MDGDNTKHNRRTANQKVIRCDADIKEAISKSPEEKLREEYRDLIRTSYRTARCLGDDLDSSVGSSYGPMISQSRHRHMSHPEIQNRAQQERRSHRMIMRGDEHIISSSQEIICSNHDHIHHPPIEVTHLMDDSDDESCGLRFTNPLAVGEGEIREDREDGDIESVYIDIDEFRDTESLRRIDSSAKKDEERDIYYLTSNRGYF